MKWISTTIILTIFIFAGCQSAEEIEHQKYLSARNKAASESCIDLGGVPIYSGWDGRLVDCKFKK
jgi:hypothetical protein